ncbi:MAG: L,D-transpeptidase/peptidoglycan binding protein [Lachnospiraceae bacterium]|nr:L,D-transpeptidase/peptidoglycan binding protein [Lachnospiraceae bacterium]
MSKKKKQEEKTTIEEVKETAPEEAKEPEKAGKSGDAKASDKSAESETEERSAENVKPEDPGEPEEAVKKSAGKSGKKAKPKKEEESKEEEAPKEDEEPDEFDDPDADEEPEEAVVLKDTEEPEQPEQPEQGKKRSGWLVLLCVILALCLLYGAVTAFYQTRYMPGTVISGYAAGNHSVAELNSALTRNVADYTLTLSLEDGASEVLQGGDFAYGVSYERSLAKILASQKSYEWPWYLFYPATYQAEPETVYDEGQLLAVLSELDCYRMKEENASALVAIENRMNHFTLRDDRKDAIEPAKATEMVLAALKTGESSCDLTGAYVKPEATAMQEQVLKRWEAVEKIQNAVVTYEDGDVSLVVDRHDFAPWITVDSDKQPILDADGNVILDEEKVREFLSKVSDTFNTDQKDRIWNKYKGGTVSLPSRNKGYIVDEDAELTALMNTVSKGYREIRKPYYSQEGTGHGNGEVGDTYVEVDLGHQKLYYFEKGALKLQSDIVTGCKRYHYDTPSMITSIYYMQKNRTLHGENYATFVYYWMAFYNHYGLHDATWRSKFGGDIYQTDGSHGCVNMPKENAAKLYDMVHVGTPVVLYE